MTNIIYKIYKYEYYLFKNSPAPTLTALIIIRENPLQSFHVL